MMTKFISTFHKVLPVELCKLGDFHVDQFTYTFISSHLIEKKRNQERAPKTGEKGGRRGPAFDFTLRLEKLVK